MKKSEELTKKQKALLEAYPQFMETVIKLLRTIYCPEADSIEAVNFALSISEYKRTENLEKFSEMLSNIFSYIMSMKRCLKIYIKIKNDMPELWEKRKKIEVKL